MLVNHNGKWFTTNPYYLGKNSVYEIELMQKRKRFFNENFSVEKVGNRFELLCNGRFVSSWYKGEKAKARTIIDSAINTLMIVKEK